MAKLNLINGVCQLSSTFYSLIRKSK